MLINDVIEVMPVLANALNETAEELTNKLMEIIQSEVYSYGASWTNGYEGEFGRTGQFGESWEKKEAVIKGNIVSSEIFQNYAAMSYNPPFSHGSHQSGALNVDGLAEIIEDGLAPYHLGFPATASRPFWSEFEKYVDSNIDTIFTKHCRGVGVDLRAGFGS